MIALHGDEDRDPGRTLSTKKVYSPFVCYMNERPVWPECHQNCLRRSSGQLKWAHLPAFWSTCRYLPLQRTSSADAGGPFEHAAARQPAGFSSRAIAHWKELVKLSPMPAQSERDFLCLSNARGDTEKSVDKAYRVER